MINFTVFRSQIRVWAWVAVLWLCLVQMAKGQVNIAAHTFSGSVTSSTSTRNTSGTLASKVNYTGLILGSLTAATATGAYQATGWTMAGTPNDNHYFEFSISPASTYQLNFTSLSISLTRGTNGPQNIRLRYSTNGGSSFTDVGTYNHTSNNFTVNPSSSLPANVGSTNGVLFRIYGYNNGTSGSAASRSLSINNFTFTGYVSRLTTSVSSLTSLNYTGAGPSASQNFSLSGTGLTGSDVVLTAPTNFQISTNNSTFSNTITLTSYSGSSTTIYARLISGLTVGSYSGNITITGGGASSISVALSGAVSAGLFASPSSLTGLNYASSFGPSASQSFVLSGSGLNGTNVTLTPSGSNFELSTNNSTFTNTITLTSFSGTSTTIYARLKSGLAVNTYNSTVTIAGGSVSSISVSLAGTVSPVLIPSPTSLSGFAYVVGFGPSANQSFSLSGISLTSM